MNSKEVGGGGALGGRRNLRDISGGLHDSKLQLTKAHTEVAPNGTKVNKRITKPINNITSKDSDSSDDFEERRKRIKQ